MKEEKNERARINQVALKSFVKRGFHGASMMFIAEEAGVCTCTMDRFFESKNDLIRKLAREVESKMTESLLSSYNEKLPYKERFMTFFTGLLRYLLKNPIESRFLEQFYSSPFGVEKARHEIEHPELNERDPFYRIINEGIDQKVFKDLPAEVLCAMILNPLVTLTQDRITSFITFDEKLMQATVSSCWDAVAR